MWRNSKGERRQAAAVESIEVSLHLPATLNRDRDCGCGRLAR